MRTEGKIAQHIELDSNVDIHFINILMYSFGMKTSASFAGIYV